MKVFYAKDFSGDMMAGVADKVYRPPQDTMVVRIEKFEKGVSHYAGESTNLEIMQPSGEFVFENVIELKFFDSLTEVLQYFAQKYLAAYSEDAHTRNIIENIFFHSDHEFVDSLYTMFGWME